ncbi:MAG: hypothetical protein JWN52_4652 [Actinomycetia bacterium]|nr:hypothetical protein [Actinomycetes bacterium]
MYVAALVIGMILLALGAGGGFRLLFDHGNTGLVDWVPGGFWAHLIASVIIAVVGVLLAGWADTQRKKAG